MRIEIEIDDELMRRCCHLTKEKSPTDAIRAAVRDYVNRATYELFKSGPPIEFDADWVEERAREHPKT